MADIIRLRGSPHEQTQALLPWYANGTLDAEDQAQVEAHLAACAECRAELEGERALASQIASLPMDMEHGWAKMAGDLDARPRPGRVVRFLRKRAPVGWLVGSQLANAAALLLLAAYVVIPSTSDSPRYRALGAATSETGNMVVIFQPETSERDMRALLLQTGSRLVGGPNAAGAYVLSVPATGRDAALNRLRAMPQIVLAEPVDAGEAQ